MARNGTTASLAWVRQAQIVLVVRVSSSAHAATMISWLRKVDIAVFEITMTIPEAWC